MCKWLHNPLFPRNLSFAIRPSFNTRESVKLCQTNLILMEVVKDLLDLLFFSGKGRYLKKLEQNKNNIFESFTELNKEYVSEFYFTKKSLMKWKLKWGSLKGIVQRYNGKRKKVQSPYDNELSLISQALSDDKFLSTRNRRYIQEEISRYRSYFDSLEKFPLSQKQCEAIVIDEYRNLIVAGAGTGKTSTLVGKVGYIIKKGLVKPEEILLLSFGRGPKDEMLERTQKRFGLPLDVCTFHGLGMRIIAEAQSYKPRVSRLSNDQTALQKFIEEVVEEGKQDRVFLGNINRFFLSLTEKKTQWDFQNLGEYLEYIWSQHPRSLKGDLVKSFEELEIANFLYVNGIDYEYERRYEYPTASKLHGQYQPDFYLPTYGIYIEHFGVDRQGNTAPSVQKDKYNEAMKWKRSLHKVHCTDLIETYSYEASEGILLAGLEAKLKEKDVKLKPIAEEDLFEQLNDLGLIQPLAGLLASFLNLYKSNNITPTELRERAENAKNSVRSRAFVSIFEQVHREYDAHLASLGEVDFNDLINKATEYISSGRVPTSYRYILVDEFQDISQSRYKLLKAILDRNPDCKLFAVGDDWQSIYRFAGSDLNILTSFVKHFGETEIMFIDETFRFNNKICDFSTKFILANPKQIRKTLKPHDVVEKPAVSLVFTEDPGTEVKAILSQLREQGGSVQILGRYNYQRPSIDRQSSLSVEFQSVHKSKGTQSDYVIILGLESGTMGFPCEITDDPVLSLVMSDQDSYPHAEERRLFYVALTRARKHVYLLADPKNPSTFMTEILRDGYDIDFRKDRADSLGACPRCSGEMTHRVGEFGEFYSCRNFPYCTYKAPICLICNEGHMLLDGKELRCSVCKKSYPQCPSCREGFLVERNGRYGRFLGCNNYPECTYTTQPGHDTQLN